MFRATRIAIAALLAVTITALPIVLDRCAESCEAHRHSAAVTPPCHHASATGAHVSSVPTPCGHDHSASAVTVMTSPAPSAAAFHPIVVVDADLAVASTATARLSVWPHSPPHSSLSLDHRSLPLRL